MSDVAPLLSIVTPAFNEASNVSLVYSAITQVLRDIEGGFEWVVVDDHSRDGTFELVAQIAARDGRVRAMRLARNSGSHVAIFCGLEHARGRCAVTLVADLQDPPRIMLEMLEAWKSGAQVVWAVRDRPPQETALNRAFGRMYYKLLNGWAKLDMPPAGSDMVLLDRTAIDGLRRFRELNLSLFALIAWMGFRQTSVLFEKQSRTHGVSGWTFQKRVKLVVDSLISFTFLPVRFFSLAGMASAVLGFLYAALIIVRFAMGHRVEGWSSLMVAILVFSGVQLLMLGVLGEYLWRTLGEARGRPRYLIEAKTDSR